MDIAQLRFPDTVTNLAVRTIREHLEGLKDLNGAEVFATVRDGIFIPTDGAPVPTDREVPAARIWIDSGRGTNDATELFITEMQVTLSIYLYWYDFARDGLSIQERRQAMTEYVVASLMRPNDDDESGFGLRTDLDVWWFRTDGTIVVDHTTTFRRVYDQVMLAPNWYATRIDIPIETNGISNTLIDVSP